MDERAESTKGAARAWADETRRSISWLVYLNAEDWGDSDNWGDDDSGGGNDAAGAGGQLVAYCRTAGAAAAATTPAEAAPPTPPLLSRHGPAGAWRGDLQVGWLVGAGAEPVYLDAWVQTASGYAPPAPQWRPLAQLYRVRQRRRLPPYNGSRSRDDDADNEGVGNGSGGGDDSGGSGATWERQNVSPPFTPGEGRWPVAQDDDSGNGFTAAELGVAFAAQLASPKHRRSFVAVDDVPPPSAFARRSKPRPYPSVRPEERRPDDSGDPSSSSGISSSSNDGDGGGGGGGGEGSADASKSAADEGHGGAVAGWFRVAVAPRGGTLVLFDSATVLHEVAPTLKGLRVAVAGWLHEPQKAFPEWYGS
jgi:hypothetical protein